MAKALGMIETVGLARSIEVADVMLKKAHVRIVNQERIDVALVTLFVEGDASAVQIAVEAAKEVAERTGSLVSCHVISQPHIEMNVLLQEIGQNKSLMYWK